MDDWENITATTAAPNGSSNHPQASAHPLLMSAYSLVFLLSLVLNGLTLRVYFCQARHHTGVSMYLQNLAAADFLLSLSLPLRIANYATDSPTLRQAYCSFGTSALYVNMYASILFMEYIAANRYLKIVRPLENHALQTVLTARYVSIGTWASLLVPATVYMCLTLRSPLGSSSKTPSKRCETLHSPDLSMFYRVLHTISTMAFFFVLVSLCFFYFQITKRLKQAQQASNKRLVKSKRNMLVLVSVFCVCFGPYHFVRLPYMFLKPHLPWDGWEQVFYYLKEFTVLLSILNVCLDPFIYFIFCKEFRARLGLRRSVVQRQGIALGQDDPNHPHSETRNSLSAQKDMTVI